MKKEGITWCVRIAMFIGVAVQNKKVADIYPIYLDELETAESAVQASQLSGEMALVGMVELSALLVAIVFWVMIELTLKEIFKVRGKSKWVD